MATCLLLRFRANLGISAEHYRCSSSPLLAVHVLPKLTGHTLMSFFRYEILTKKLKKGGCDQKNVQDLQFPESIQRYRSSTAWRGVRLL